jgi:phage FluMu gp28-like protein
MLADVWRSFKTALSDLVTVKNEQEKRLDLRGGGVIDFWSLDNPNAARGRKYAGVVIDEAAWVSDLEYAWSAVIAPTLTDYRGWAWFLSTPRGRDYFWMLYLMGQDPTKVEWASWSFPTTANPYMPAQEVESRRDLLPDRIFRQEYLAEFIEDGGAVFRNVTACARPLYGCALPQRRIVFGVDWGKSEDFTAIAVMDADTRECLLVDRFNEVGWSLQRGRIMALAATWHPRAVWAEENSIGAPNIEALQAEGLPVYPFQTTPISKGPLIESLALAFERGEIALPANPVLIGELQAYSMERLPSGRFAYSAPAGMHDDTVIALALAWHGASRPAARDLVDWV